ncbi:MAG: glycosyltransferase family 4 protein [Xanthomonadales bacterium PRO7]|nr:glycosyltransferase family 4 protein [Xanthomonadales bacterium PRO7]
MRRVTAAGKPVILVLASTYPRRAGDHEPGFVHELCKRLTAQFEVVVLTARSPGAAAAETIDGVEIVRYAYAPARWETLAHNGGITVNLRRHKWKWLLVPSFFLAQYFAARAIVRKRHVDAVHAHWLLLQGLVARRLRKRFGIPYLVTSHGADLFGLRSRLAGWLKRLVANDCAIMTVVSSAMREEAARIGLRPPRIEVLSMGVDLRNRFVPDARTQRADGELLFVGRLVPKKGLTHLLDALPAVLARRPQARLVVAGFGPDEEALRAKALALKVHDRVEFVGPIAQDKLADMYRHAAVFVAPFVQDANGDQEGLGLVVVEAIGCGCPVVASALPALRDVFGNELVGLVEPGNAEALADAILTVLDTFGRADSLRDRLRERVVAKFDWEIVADQHADLLGTAITARKEAFDARSQD